MKKMFITELSFEELKRVIEANDKLHEQLEEISIDQANDYVLYEYLHGWEGIDWGITASEYGSRGDYFLVKDNRKFLDGLKENVRMYGFLPDSMNATIERAEELNDRLIELEWDLSIENYNRLENRVEELIEELRSESIKRIRDEYKWAAHIDTLADMVLCNPDAYENIFIDTESGELTAYKEVHYIKSYAA